MTSPGAEHRVPVARAVPEAHWLNGKAGSFVLLVTVTLAAYYPALRAGFIWNDSDYVTAPALRSLGGLWKIWFKVGATEQYYPLLHSSFWLEHRLWGDSAFGYHLVNVLLHATAAWLLAQVLRLFVERDPWTHILDVPLLAGLLFALHPVCVESVAWISEQKNTLSTVFYLLSALVYLGSEERRPGRYALALGLFIMACLAKTVAATLPGALLVAIWWRRGSLSWRRDFVPLFPWFAVGATSGLFSAWVEKTYVGAQGSEFGLDAFQRVLLAGHAVWFYLGKLAWPANLIFIYPRWTVSASNPVLYLDAAGVVVVAAFLWLARGWRRGPLAAALFFLGSLFPVCGFFNLYAFIYSYVADHWQYLPAVGIVSLAAGAWGMAARGRLLGRPLVREGLPALVLAVLGVLTFRQSGMYRDMETFYRRTIASNPACWMARANLGLELVSSGRSGEAVSAFRQALKLDPASPEVIHNDLGSALLDLGKVPEAESEFSEALRLNPGYDRASYNLGNALLRQDRLGEAAEQFERALKTDVGNPVTHNNLGTTFARMGEDSRAEAEFREAVRLNPDYVQAHFNLGLICQRRNRVPEAIAEFEEVLRLQPGQIAATARLRRLQAP